MIKILIDVIVIAAIILGLEKYNKNATLDFGGVASLVIAPAICVLLLSLAIGLMGLSPMLSLLGYFLYFLIPFGMLKTSFEYSYKRAISYSAVFLVTVFVTEIVLFVLIQGAASA